MSLDKARPRWSSVGAHAALGMQKWVVLGAQSHASPDDVHGPPHSTLSLTNPPHQELQLGQRLLVNSEIEGENVVGFFFGDYSIFPKN